MGGDHGHGPNVKFPDWRSYKVEAIPELTAVQRALAADGLKDPWLRNNVWRYQNQLTTAKKFRYIVFRGFWWGLGLAVLTAGAEKYWDSKQTHHGHDHH